VSVASGSSSQHGFSYSAGTLCALSSLSLVLESSMWRSLPPTHHEVGPCVLRSIIYTIGEIHFASHWAMSTTQHVLMSSTFMLQAIVRILHMNQTLPGTAHHPPPAIRCRVSHSASDFVARVPLCTYSCRLVALLSARLDHHRHPLLLPPAGERLPALRPPVDGHHVHDALRRPDHRAVDRALYSAGQDLLALAHELRLL